MAFNPDQRLQSAAALRDEVKKAIDHLEYRKNNPDSGNDDGQMMEEDELPTAEGEGYVVMLVETKPNLQNAIRERLKSRGYRVLIIQDPNRALARFIADEDKPADCVIFGAAELGNLALEAFNQFATTEHTAEIPSILLVDRKQSRIIAEARRGSNRMLLGLPLKVRELRGALMKLLSDVERRQLGSF